MNPFDHPTHNMLLKGAPESGVMDLACTRVTFEGMGLAFLTHWKPSPEELALLNANGCVELRTMGSVFPPVWLEVVK